MLVGEAGGGVDDMGALLVVGIIFEEAVKEVDITGVTLAVGAVMEEVGVSDTVIVDEVGFSDVVPVVVDFTFVLRDASSSLVVSGIYASSITLMGSVRSVEGSFAVDCRFTGSYRIQSAKSDIRPKVPK